MHRRIQIKDALIVNEGRRFVGSVLIDNDRIEEVLEGADARTSIPADEVVDARGLVLMPGVIDEHVHFRDPGFPHKADIDTESLAAAAGGTTTVLDMPNNQPPTTTLEAFDDKMRAFARRCHVNYGCFFGATDDNYLLLKQLNPRRVAGVKVFMGNSTGNMGLTSAVALHQVFDDSPTLIVAHCEDTKIIAENMREAQKKFGDDPNVLHHSEIRSREACLRSTKEAIKLAREYGARLHVAHVSTADELKLFGKDENITAEVCLAHLLFCDEDYARLGTRIKCNPAVKTRADRDALRKALTDGPISTVATDHAPHTVRDKQGGARRAASGMPMVQFALPAMLGLCDEGVLTLERLVELMCHEPARLFSIESRGFIREGFKADLVLVRPNMPWTLTPNLIRSRCNWSPLEGRRFNWRVEKTYCNGFLVYNKGHLTDENIHGEAITFGR